MDSMYGGCANIAAFYRWGNVIQCELPSTDRITRIYRLKIFDCFSAKIILIELTIPIYLAYSAIVVSMIPTVAKLQI